MNQSIPRSHSRFKVSGVIRSAVVLACFAAGLSRSALAIDAGWVGTAGDFNYNNSLNWNQAGVNGVLDAPAMNVVPSIPGTAYFDSYGGASPKTLNNTTTRINAYSFNAGATSYTLGTSVGDGTISLSVDSGGGRIGLVSGAASQLFNSNIILAADTATVGAKVGNYVWTNNSAGNTLSVAGNITGGTGGAAGLKTLTLAGTGGNFNLSGNITQGGGTEIVIIQSGTGNATLSGNNALSATTTTQIDGVNYSVAYLQSAAGTLSIGSDTALNGATINETTNIFRSTASGGTIQAVGGARIVANTIMTASNGTLNIGGGNNITFNGKVIGNGGTTNLAIANTGLTTFNGDFIPRRNAGGVRATTFTGAGTAVINGVLTNGDLLASGASPYVFNGTGIVKSTGTNTYTGLTTIGGAGTGGGTFLVNGTHSTGAGYTVGTGTIPATLGGTGSITTTGTTAVTISAAGSLAPGDSVLPVAAQTGTLDIGKLTFTGGSTLNIQLGGLTPGDGQGFYDQVNVTSTTAGAFKLVANVNLTLSVVNSPVVLPTDAFYILTRADITANGIFFNNNGVVATDEGAVTFADGSTGNITYFANWTGSQATSTLNGGNDIALYNVVLVPEPSTYALLISGLWISFMAFRHKRRSVLG